MILSEVLFQKRSLVWDKSIAVFTNDHFRVSDLFNSLGDSNQGAGRAFRFDWGIGWHGSKYRASVTVLSVFVKIGL